MMVNELMTPEEPSINRRLRVFYLDQGNLLYFLRGGHRTAGIVTIPITKGIPPTAFVNNCYFDARRKALAVIVSDKSFDIVPPGQEIPGDDLLSVQYEGVRIARPIPASEDLQDHYGIALESSGDVQADGETEPFSVLLNTGT